jgi:hypothetical protein
MQLKSQRKLQDLYAGVEFPTPGVAEPAPDYGIPVKG